VRVDRISEQVQANAELMGRFNAAGLRPGHVLHVAPTPKGVEVWEAGERTGFDRFVADHVFVAFADKAAARQVA
jgi:hypothetical protein